MDEQEMKSDRLDLRNNLTSLLYGSSAGHWLIKGIERFLVRWLESHGIKLVLSDMTQNVHLSIKPRAHELTCWVKICVFLCVSLSQLLLKLQDNSLQLLLLLQATALKFLQTGLELLVL